MQRSAGRTTKVRIPPDPAFQQAADIRRGWIENLRRAMGDLSNRELARRVGVHSTTINRVLNGEITPDDELKIKIAGALSCNLRDLWEWPSFTPSKPDVAA